MSKGDTRVSPKDPAKQDDKERPLQAIVDEVTQVVGVQEQSMGPALAAVLHELGLPDEGTDKEKAYRAAAELGISIYTPVNLERSDLSSARPSDGSQMELEMTIVSHHTVSEDLSVEDLSDASN